MSVVRYACRVGLVVATCSLFAPLALAKDGDGNRSHSPNIASIIYSNNIKSTRLYEDGKYQEALTLAEYTLKKAEAELGENDRNTLTSLQNLAVFYGTLNRYEEAAAMSEKALAARERTLGHDAPDTIKSMNNLAYIYSKLGRDKESEQLYLRSIDLMKGDISRYKEKIEDNVRALGIMYESAGRYDDAENIYTIVNNEKFEPNGDINNMYFEHDMYSADLYTKQGRYGEAEVLYDQMYDKYGKGLLHHDPLSMWVLRSLSTFYYKMARYQEAEVLALRVLEESERQSAFLLPEFREQDREYRRNSPATLRYVIDLAHIYVAEGRLDEAEKLYQRALKRYKDDKVESVYITAYLENVHRKQGRPSHLEQALRAALALNERRFGREAQSTLSWVNRLARFYREEGQPQKAKPLYERALEGAERVLGHHNPVTLDGLDGLAYVYQSEGRLDQAEALYVRAVGSRERVLGSNHPDTQESLKGLVSLYQGQGRAADAEQLLKRFPQRHGGKR
ncbi:tetratricopeptide repeat protein [Insolitispirillum peregrinum]|uniref:Tetratricopeptide repeat-containing protein n=1 Tax=Insolitispirillum peregrinum TaxID=80876 RepID=A0A1N7K7D2_9PROT|nr:tetratricopeptide repeat protein [Insolitispirillum peregrinum]SIS57489.1 Tetratricopeptide repeat-containing protein [Insolitispirillum peregrinum]